MKEKYDNDMRNTRVQLHNLFQFACVLQVRKDKLFLRDLDFLLALFRESDSRCSQIYLPSALYYNKSIFPTIFRIERLDLSYLLRKVHQLRLTREEQQGRCVLQWQAIIRSLLAARNLVPTYGQEKEKEKDISCTILRPPSPTHKIHTE